jgi:hypothetical protein
MIEVLLIIVVIFEAIRFVLYVQDSSRIKRTNTIAQEQQLKNAEFVKQQNDEWKQIRAAEIAELKELAKSSDTMKQIYDEWLKIPDQWLKLPDQRG